MALLPSTSDSAIRENIRSLRKQGFSEQEAILRARGQTSSEGEEDAGLEADSPSSASSRQFVVVTKDFSGLGWAKKLHEEGEQVTLAVHCEEKKHEDQQMFNHVGSGWFEVVELKDAMKHLCTPSTYWIFSENYFCEEAEALRTKGQKVFGTSLFTDNMEHDRQKAVDIANEHGLPSPPTHPFTSLDEGLSFLDEHLTTAYVFKPDDGTFNYMTFVPVRREGEDANRECYNYLSHMKKDPGPYILQERVGGIELNTEVWLYEGEPILASLGLELKRKNTYDLGEMSGCAGDFVQMIPLECKLVKETIGKLLPYYKEEQYTGFADVNVIWTKDGPLFLEVCNRLGYNAHITMFLALATDGFGNILADFMNGQVNGMADRFRKDVGCSLTLFLDHPREGLPVHISEEFREQYYPFDGYYDDDETLLLTGYSSEVGVFTDHGKTMESAATSLWRSVVEFEAVSFPDMHYRTDLVKDDYPNAPVKRYKAIQEMGLL